MTVSKVWVLCAWLSSAACVSAAESDDTARLELWRRGVHEPVRCVGASSCAALEEAAALARRTLPVLRHRGGALSSEDTAVHEAPDLEALTAELGPLFAAALRSNELEHAADCLKSCELFYCAPKPEESAAPPSHLVPTRNISMGSVPPEDFASEFRYPLDLIKVTRRPVVSPESARSAILTARGEDVDSNEYTSGKYRLGGDWLSKMPKTRAWFNGELERSIFPQIAASFPEVVRDVSTLRAHSVAMLKYNATHPRTDVHIDNGVLALTLALSPIGDYAGGGTFFEHLGEEELVEMDAGFATWRPGSVRHGGHRVTSGERYIIGAFLLLEDRVEHVRRLKNRGSKLRETGDYRGAIQHFQWALRLNSQCATCLKDLSEARAALADADASLDASRLLQTAERDLRAALDLLPSDSDALFSLGVVLSKQGDAEGALDAYERSAAVNADDVELLYNLAVKLGELGRGADEAEMYRRALERDFRFSKARCNLGASLAESGDFEGAEAEFVSAISTDPTSLTAWQNLGVLYHRRGLDRAKGLASATSREHATELALQADSHLQQAEEAWRKALEFGGDALANLAHTLALRGRATAVHDLPAALPHFQAATRANPTDEGNWRALAKVHDLLGDVAEAAKAAERADAARANSAAYSA